MGDKIKSQHIDYKPDMKMLNYKKYIPVKEEKKVIIPIVDMHKIFPYSKLGQKFQNKKKSRSRNIELPFLNSQSCELIKYDYKNPYGIIKDIAKNEYYVNDRFNRRSYLLENNLHADSLPNIITYENILRKKSEKIKNDRKKRNEIVSKIQLESLIDKSEIFRKKIEDDIVNKWDKLIEKLDNEIK